MKKVFKGGGAFLGLASGFAVTTLIFVILLIRSLITNDGQIGAGLIGIPLTLFFFCLMLAIAHKFLLSTITFSEQGIEWKMFKKRLKFFKWEEVTSVETGKAGTTAFLRGAERIELIISIWTYRAILRICPREYVEYIKKQIDKESPDLPKWEERKQKRKG